MKGDVKEKNSLPSPRGKPGRGDIQPCLLIRGAFDVAALDRRVIQRPMPASVDNPDLMVSCNGRSTPVGYEATQAQCWLKCQPSSYVRLEAYGFVGLSAGA